MRYANTKRAKARGRWIVYTMSAWFKDGTKSYWKASFLGDTQMRESFISRLGEKIVPAYKIRVNSIDGEKVNKSFIKN